MLILVRLGFCFAIFEESIQEFLFGGNDAVLVFIAHEHDGEIFEIGREKAAESRIDILQGDTGKQASVKFIGILL